MIFKKLILIIYLSGFFVLSCNDEKGTAGIVKNPGKVPENFYNLTDPGFSESQDTLFYRGRRFSGYVLGLNNHLDTLIKIGYLNGLQEGYARKWYANKQLMEERFYIQGGKEGTHKGWWENGNPKFEYHFFNDEFNGTVTEWFNTGKLLRKFHYQNGHESGSEKMWWENGTVRANYVIVNGEKFGLSGQKLCTNNNLNKQRK